MTLAGKTTDDGYQNSIDFVGSATDSMISQLQTEGDGDLSVMKECDYKRLALTRTMATAAREVDKNTSSCKLVRVRELHTIAGHTA